MRLQYEGRLCRRPGVPGPDSVRRRSLLEGLHEQLGLRREPIRVGVRQGDRSVRRLRDERGLRRQPRGTALQHLDEHLRVHRGCRLRGFSRRQGVRAVRAADSDLHLQDEGGLPIG